MNIHQKMILQILMLIKFCESGAFDLQKLGHEVAYAENVDYKEYSASGH
jgi:hypothetical protein